MNFRKTSRKPSISCDGRRPRLPAPGRFLVALSALVLSETAAGADFEQDVRPILSGKCFSCHGEKRQESGLRLDRRETALKGGDHGALLVPGKSAVSLLYLVVTGKHAELARMPRKGPPLTAEEVEAIRSWIDSGAVWPDDAADARAAKARAHWAFHAPVRPKLPSVRDGTWARNAIDLFILERLEREGLRPSPEADEVTLLRRLHLDLIGLLPSVQQVDQYLEEIARDGKQRAYDAAVERLLASPHYGERWGRHWLDAARYADSDGFEKDKLRFIWNYRDWVVRAFNRDLPYDQFVVDQLAGDERPDADQESRIATGFLRNSMLNEEGGIDPEQFRMDAMFDRMDAVGKSVLGLTIQCAQCHSHKFDPLTQEEYYRLFAFLNNDHEEQRVVYTPLDLQQVADIRRRVHELEDGIRHTLPDWEKRLGEWEEQVKSDATSWTVVVPHLLSEADTRFYEQKDGSLLGLGYAPTQFDYVFQAVVKVPELHAVRLELVPDPNLPCGGPGRSIWGTCALTEFKVEAAAESEPGKKSQVAFTGVTADYSNPKRALESIFDDRSGRSRVTGPVEYAMDGKDETAWGIDAGPGRRNVDRNAVFVAEKNFAAGESTILTFHIVTNHGGWNSDDNQNNNIGRFRLCVSSSPKAKASSVPKHVREILDLPRESRSPAQTATVFTCWRKSQEDLREVNGKIDAIEAGWPEGSSTLTLAAREEQRATTILKRGDWLKPDRSVTPGVPAFLHQLPAGYAPTRWTFARWLVDPKAPTTARVFTNRVWQAYFGTGLVDTPEDFGLQSTAPSHPELLDWLACEFMDGGWGVKALHRRIVSSSTYRQSSRVTPQLATLDPQNRLLARGARLRVEGEIVHDIALAASGLLDERLGGAGIFAPAPAFLFQPPASYGPFNWIDAVGADRYRRALYTFRRRSTPYPPLLIFDTPNGDFSCVRRSRSNTALQALTTLNEPVFFECARALARRASAESGPTLESRIAYAFRCVLSRQPTPDELAELSSFYERQKSRVAEGWVNASDLAGDPATLRASAPPTQVAALAAVARILLNLDEAITKE